MLAGKHGCSISNLLFWVGLPSTSSLLPNHEMKIIVTSVVKMRPNPWYHNHTWYQNHECQYHSFTDYSTHPWHHSFLTYICAANELVNTKKAFYNSRPLRSFITHLSKQIGSQLNACFVCQQSTENSDRAMLQLQFYIYQQFFLSRPYHIYLDMYE